MRLIKKVPIEKGECQCITGCFLNVSAPQDCMMDKGRLAPEYIANILIVRGKSMIAGKVILLALS